VDISTWNYYPAFLEIAHFPSLSLK